jgi:beta-lactam-binding protein with PASTA domain
MDKPHPGRKGWAVCLFLALLGWAVPGGPQPTVTPPPPLQGEATVGPVEVPPLQGMQVPQARSLLRQRSLMLQEMGTRPGRRPPGTIIAQDPEPGQKVRRGTTVRVWLAGPAHPAGSVPSPLVPVPDLVGRSPSQAESLLSDRKLRLGQKNTVGGGGPPNTIVRQYPAAGKRVPLETAVVVWVAAGDDRVVVPPVVGLEENQARQRLYPVPLNVGGVRRFHHPRPAGEVLGQTPGPGTRVPRHSRVDLEVSLGPPPPEDIKVPGVVSLTLSQARQRLMAHDLRVGDLRRQPHPEDPGTVFRQDPGPGTRRPRGSPVDLWVSLGPKEDDPQRKIRVPDLSGREREEARRLLVEQGLAPGRTGWQEDAAHREGTIIRQDPEAGTWVDRGAPVHLWLARRPESPARPPGPGDGVSPSGDDRRTVRVPDLRGRALGEADLLLQENRLRRGRVGREYCLKGAGLIRRQSPPPHSYASVGQVVHLRVGEALPASGLVGGGALAALLGLGGYHAFRKRFRPRPVSLTARPGGLEDMNVDLEWPGPEPQTLELSVRVCPDDGVQDLEAPGPLIQGERREHD